MQFPCRKGALPSWRAWRCINERHRVAELPSAVLPILHRYREHALEHRDELALGDRDDRVGDLRLTPEHLPVALLHGLHAVELGLPRAALSLRQELTERHVERAHLGGEDRIGAAKRRDLRSAQEE